MKQLIKVSALLLGLMVTVSMHAQMSGPVDVETTPVPDRTETDQIRFVCDELAYIPGGVTFNYPVGAFTVPPCAFVLANVPAPVADTAFVATLDANSTTDIHVVVYKITSTAGVPTGMVEATLGDNVMVYLYATGA